jgi:large subunit ribosomal protein L29
MPLPKISDVRGLSDQELAEQIVALKRQLFELRLQKATRRLEKFHLFKHTRHHLAQLMTVENERRRAETFNPSNTTVAIASEE